MTLVFALAVAFQGTPPASPPAPPPPPSPPHARAESLLAEGELRAARSALDEAVRRDPDDVRALVLLGRVHLAWPVVGRWKAWELFERAARRAPDEPEPRYRQALVGRHLQGDDGERLIRDAVFAVWRLDPGYRDTWALWAPLYKNEGHRRRAVAILSAHAGHSVADLRRAKLLVELGAEPEAAGLLDSIARRGRDDGTVWALMAQNALEAGDTTRGLDRYAEALRRAASDSLGLLWDQVAPIATPLEDSLYRALAPRERADFFRAFWARREPDLTTRENERVVEHFARLRHARARYPLLHPLAAYHRSPLRRALVGTLAPAVLQATREFGLRNQPLPGHSRLADEIAAAGLAVDARDLPEPDSVTRYRRFGLDGRGVIYLRYGEPQRRWIAAGTLGGDVELWSYTLDGRTVWLSFARATGGVDFGGDMVLYPTSRRELHNAALLLERDATALPAELALGAWFATFRDIAQDVQLLYLGSDADSGAAGVWDAAWHERERQRGDGLYRFRLAAGRYHVGLDGRRGGRFGRVRADVDVPWYWDDGPAVSSLLIATLAAVDTAGGRDAVARAMPADLRLPTEQPLVLYAEVYGLRPAADGSVAYEATYVFEPLDGGRPVALAFERRVRAALTLVERVTLDPRRVPRGRYRVRLVVRDHTSDLVARASTLIVTLR